MSKKFLVWPVWYPDDEAIETGTTVDALDEREAAEIVSDNKFSDWEYPSEISVKVILSGRPIAEAKTYDVFVESIPHFHAALKR